MPLDPSKKQVILSALRSGEYTQARRTLGDFETKHLCCIGVAAHACGFGGFWYDLTTAAGRFIGLESAEISEWVMWNDTHGFSFAEIADLIEEKY